MDYYDFIIIGAGTAGCACAKILSERFKVCLVDKKPKNKIGDKVCGDGISLECFKLIKKIFGVEDFIERRFNRGMIRYGDEEIVVKGKGFTIDRHLMSQLLLESCEKVKLFDNCGVVDFKNGMVKLSTGNVIKGRFVVNASGVNSVIRKIDRTDVAVCYRSIAESKDECDDCVFILSDELPGGYSWIFPKKDCVNIGCGTSLPAGYRLMPMYNILFKDFKKVSYGSGLVPLRRPLNSIVFNNGFFVGDSACTVSPVHGGGIRQSILAGDIICGELLDNSDLWSANVKFQKSLGKELAVEQLVREFGTSLNFGDVFQLFKVQDYKGAKSLIKSILKLSNPSLLFKTVKFKLFYSKIINLYNNYPAEAGGFGIWNGNCNGLFDDIKKSFHQ